MIMGAALGATDMFEEAESGCVSVVALELTATDTDGIPQLRSLFPGENTRDLEASAKQNLENLSVELVAKAHGQTVGNGNQPSEALRAFARACLQSPQAEAELWTCLKTRPKLSGKLSEVNANLWLKPFQLNGSLQSAAIDGGLLQTCEGGVCISRPADGNADQKRGGIARNAKLLTGAWVELALFQYAVKQQFRDIQWSTDERGANTEHDLLALKGATLVVGSAKRSIQGQRIYAHLHELRAQANRLGGRKSIALLAIANLCGGDREVHELKRVAALVGVQIIGPDELRAAF
jgi:hypothetical protein